MISKCTRSNNKASKQAPLAHHIALTVPKLYTLQSAEQRVPSKRRDSLKPTPKSDAPRSNMTYSERAGLAPCCLISFLT